MKRTSPAARVRRAQAELAAAECELRNSLKPWRQRLQRHGGAIVLCSGFVSGAALAFLPPRWWARVGAVLGATAASAARSALTPALIGAALSRMRRSDPATQTSAQSPEA